MSPDLVRANIAVVSTQGYRAESVALAVSAKTGCRTKAFTRLDAPAFAGFDMILVEMTSDLEGDLAWVRAITARHPDAQVVLMGLVESEERVVKLAEAGAGGYVAPEASLRDLITVLESVCRGEFTCPPHINYALFTHLAHLAGGDTLVLPEAPVLTMRERKVVELLSHNLTNKEIAARLCISEYTAKNHVHRILKKLGLHDRNKAAHSSGLRRPDVSPQRFAARAG